MTIFANDSNIKRYTYHLFNAIRLIQTYIGHVLISVNPFRDLGIYTDAVLDSYRGRNRLEVIMPPQTISLL